jgi:chemotaxis response regulator CheB
VRNLASGVIAVELACACGQPVTVLTGRAVHRSPAGGAADPATDPATDAAADPAADPATDAAADPATDAATDAAADAAADPATDGMVDPAADGMADAAADGGRTIARGAHPCHRASLPGSATRRWWATGPGDPRRAARS